MNSCQKERTMNELRLKAMRNPSMTLEELFKEYKEIHRGRISDEDIERNFNTFARGLHYKV
jgi:hypothetical protein